MNKAHKVLSIFIFLLSTFFAYLLEAKMTDTSAQNLVTFFSVVFGFYMTSVAILYNASYTKKLDKIIVENAQKRGTHILKSYLLFSGYWSIFSIASIILFTTFAEKNSAGVISTKIMPITPPFTDKIIDLNFLPSSILFGIAALNVFYMLLLLHTIVDGMVEEAKS